MDPIGRTHYLCVASSESNAADSVISPFDLTPTSEIKENFRRLMSTTWHDSISLSFVISSVHNSLNLAYASRELPILVGDELLGIIGFDFLSSHYELERGMRPTIAPELLTFPSHLTVRFPMHSSANRIELVSWIHRGLVDLLGHHAVSKQLNNNSFSLFSIATSSLKVHLMFYSELKASFVTTQDALQIRIGSNQEPILEDNGVGRDWCVDTVERVVRIPQSGHTHIAKVLFNYLRKGSRLHGDERKRFQEEQIFSSCDALYLFWKKCEGQGHQNGLLLCSIASQLGFSSFIKPFTKRVLADCPEDGTIWSASLRLLQENSTFHDLEKILHTVAVMGYDAPLATSVRVSTTPLSLVDNGFVYYLPSFQEISHSFPKETETLWRLVYTASLPVAFRARVLLEEGKVQNASKLLLNRNLASESTTACRDIAHNCIEKLLSGKPNSLAILLLECYFPNNPYSWQKLFDKVLYDYSWLLFDDVTFVFKKLPFLQKNLSNNHCHLIFVAALEHAQKNSKYLLDAFCWYEKVGIPSKMGWELVALARADVLELAAKVIGDLFRSNQEINFKALIAFYRVSKQQGLPLNIVQQIAYLEKQNQCYFLLEHLFDHPSQEVKEALWNSVLIWTLTATGENVTKLNKQAIGLQNHLLRTGGCLLVCEIYQLAFVSNHLKPSLIPYLDPQKPHPEAKAWACYTEPYRRMLSLCIESLDPEVCILAFDIDISIRLTNPVQADDIEKKVVDLSELRQRLLYRCIEQHGNMAPRVQNLFRYICKYVRLDSKKMKESNEIFLKKQQPE